MINLLHILGFERNNDRYTIYSHVVEDDGCARAWTQAHEYNVSNQWHAKNSLLKTLRENHTSMVVTYEAGWDQSPLTKIEKHEWFRSLDELLAKYPNMCQYPVEPVVEKQKETPVSNYDKYEVMFEIYGYEVVTTQFITFEEVLKAAIEIADQAGEEVTVFKNGSEFCNVTYDGRVEF